MKSNKIGILSNIFIVLMCIMYIISCNTFTGYAAQSDWYLGVKYPSTNINIRYLDSYNSAYTSNIEASLKAWNNATVINFKINETSKNYVEATRLSANSAYGITTYTTSGNYIANFHITLNATTISNDATNFDHFLRSVMTHELGHALGLKDNPPVSASSSIMNHTRDRNNVYTPKTYDINNIGSLYGNK